MRFAKSTIAVFAMTAATTALALEPVNTNWRGVAIDGYDPVAYFVAGAPTKGRGEFTVEWNGATWRFASRENRDLFQASPETYAPQYGGYCAKAVSEGYVADIDPQAWDVVEGKLYLNYNLNVRNIWREDRSDRIRKADRNWPTLVEKK